MTSYCRTETRDGVGIVFMRRPPSNAMSNEMVQQIQAQITALLADPAILGLVLTTDLAHFSAGSDATDLTQPTRNSKHGLAALCAFVAASAKPVVAAVRGGCLGPGLELAIAARARLASQDAQFACPEINFGLMPAAGTTLRLPALIGAAAALEMLLEATVHRADKALDLGLIDGISKDVLRDACTLAQNLRKAPATPRDLAQQARDLQSAVAAARIRYAGRPVQAYAKIIDCVEAGAVFLPDQAIALESRCYDDLLFSAESQGICYALVARHRLRAAAFPAPLPAADLGQINIAGGGAVAARLAARALVAGLAVRLADPDSAARSETLAQIAALLVADMADGRLTLAGRDAAMAQLRADTKAQGFDGSAIFLGAGADVAGGIHLVETLTTPKSGAAQLAITAAGKTHYAIAPQAAPRLAATLSGMMARLGIKTYDLAKGGSVESAMKQVLAACITLLQSQGHSRDTLIAALAASGLTSDPTRVLPRPPDQSETILATINLALANLGAKLLRQGQVPAAFAFDAVAVQAGLFPRWSGGPLYWADQRGPMVLRADLRKRTSGAPDLFSPDPLWDQVIAQGQRLADLGSA